MRRSMIDIGGGVHLAVGVTKTHFDTAVAILREKGYEVHNIHILQVVQVSIRL